jgi:hypothetical protein
MAEQFGYAEGLKAFIDQVAPQPRPIDWRQLLAQPPAGQAAKIPPAPGGFPAQPRPNMNFSAASDPYYGTSTHLQGGLSAPLGGGQVGVQGSYQNGTEGDLPRWSAIGTYRRPF